MSTSKFQVSFVSSVIGFDSHLPEFFPQIPEFGTDLSQYSGNAQFFEARNRQIASTWAHNL